MIYLIFIILIITLCIFFFLKEGTRDNFNNETINNFFLQEFERFPDPIVMNFLYKNDLNFVQSYLEQYKKDTKLGKNFIKTQKLVIAGLIRNCGYNIAYLRKMYETLKIYFASVIMIFVENDSNDDTRKRLLDWAAKDKDIIILCEDTLEINHRTCHIKWADYTIMDDYSVDSSRIGRLSKLRNIYLNYVKNKLNIYDFLMVLDYDLNGHLFLDGIFHTFSKFSQNISINMISCNGLVSRIGKPLFYYDSFAYVDKDANYIFKSKEEKIKHDVYVNKIINKRYSTSIDLDPVFSAFGGCCFYRISKILHPKIKYDYERNGFACEHSFLNKNISNCFVNPKLIFIINNYH